MTGKGSFPAVETDRPPERARIRFQFSRGMAFSRCSA